MGQLEGGRFPWYAASAFGCLAIHLPIGAAATHSHGAVAHRIQQTEARHRVRRLMNLAGYLAGFLLIALVIAEEKGHLTIAAGLVAVAVAFALQEVIANFAGWVGISFGCF